MLCELSSDIVRDRSHAHNLQHQLSVITTREETLSRMMKQALPHMREISAAKTTKEQMEYWNLFLHRSYVTSEMYRPILQRKKLSPDPTASIRGKCIKSLSNTIEAFLGLQGVAYFANRSWAALHRALSSALLLGILRKPARDPHVHDLLERLINVMLKTSSEAPNGVSVPITRSISALQLLNAASDDTSESDVPARQTSSEASPARRSSYDQTSATSNTLHASNSYSAFGSPSDTSPYALKDQILWGTTPQQNQLNFLT
jgi:hypothetical protein